MRTIHVTCAAYTQNIPYYPWHDPLRQLLDLTWEDPASVALERLRAHLELSDPELIRWLPLLAIALGVEAPMTRQVQELAPEYRSAKLREVVLRFLAPALATPTLVQIEHAQFMDEASAALLNALSEKLTSTSWLVIATRRDTETGFVASKRAVVRIQLPVLSPEDTLALAEAAPEAELLPRDMIEEAVVRSGGSPEFLLDLLAAAATGAGEMPDSLEAAASARLDALAPGDRALLCRAAVLGLSFHPDRINQVLPDDAAAPDAATWLRLQSVLARDPDGNLRFKRPAIREVAYETLPFRVRRELHGRIGEALERGLGVDADADPAMLSLHFMLANDHERAWTYARLAADRAVAKFAQADAARLYRRAIEAGGHDGASDRELAECWEALGEALKQGGHLAAAVDALTAARKLVRDDRRAQARLLLGHVRIAHRRGRLTGAVRWGTRGLRVLGDASDDESRVLRARLTAELAFIRYVQGHLTEAERLCRTVIDQFESDVEQRPWAHASYVLDLVLMDRGRFDEAGNASRALAIYERLGDLEEQGHVLNTLAGLAQCRWEWDEALRLFGQAAAAYERAGSQSGIAIAACNIGEILSDRGLYDEAAEQLGRARRIWMSNGERGAAAYAEMLLGRISARGADIDEARRLVSAAARELRTLGEMRYVEEAEAVLAEAEAFAGDAAHALMLADTLLAASSRELSIWLRRVRGVALARLGRTQAAVTELESALALARDRGARYDIAATLHVLGRLNGRSHELAAERDQLLTRLGIERLPVVQLGLADPELAATSSR
jgi:tetratricopeptide (TPR) repeat protein